MKRRRPIAALLAGALALAACAARPGSLPIDAPGREAAFRPALSQAGPPLPRQDGDPGAALLVDSIGEALDLAMHGHEQAEMLVAVGPLRNRSRVESEEVQQLAHRLAGLLDAIGRRQGLRFAAGPAEIADFQLRGTVYLLSADGFDQWELYLSMRQANKTWTVWRADGPVRVLRLPRPGRQQVFLLGRD